VLAMDVLVSTDAILVDVVMLVANIITEYCSINITLVISEKLVNRFFLF
jgi:hypothetical protein